MLTIEHLSFANGLPAGMAEIEHIERMRAKRAFEAGAYTRPLLSSTSDVSDKYTLNTP